MAATQPSQSDVEEDGRTSSPPRWARWGVRLSSGSAGLGGLAWGYEFGHRVDGVFMGVVAGVNMAVIAALLAGAAAEWVVRHLPARK